MSSTRPPVPRSSSRCSTWASGCACCERDRRRRAASRAAEAARRPCALAAEARFRDCVRGVARGRRTTPHRVHERSDTEAIADFARSRASSSSASTTNDDPRLPQRAQLEPGVLPPGAGLLSDGAPIPRGWARFSGSCDLPIRELQLSGGMRDGAQITTTTTAHSPREEIERLCMGQPLVNTQERLFFKDWRAAFSP